MEQSLAHIRPVEKWQIKRSRMVHQDRWIALRADECELPDGQVIEPYYVLEDADWVHVVAVDADGQILLVWQYRHAAGVTCYEVPGGVIDPGEDALTAAKRELREETGYEAENWEYIFAPYANPARQTNRVPCFLATGLRKVGEPQLDDTEELQSGFYPLSEIRDKIFNGEFGQAMHVSSVLTTVEHCRREGREEELGLIDS